MRMVHELEHITIGSTGGDGSSFSEKFSDVMLLANDLMLSVKLDLRLKLPLRDIQKRWKIA